VETGRKNTAVTLIIVVVIVIVLAIFAFPYLIRLRDRRRERRHPKKEHQAIADGQVKEGVTSLDGTPLHVDYIGDSDPTIFFVHGILANAQVFRYQKPFFARKYRVVSLDLRGHGRSGLPRSSGFTIERMAEDLAAVINAFKPEQFVVAGHSMGGFATFKFYEKYGREYEGRLKGLAILDSTGTDTTGMSLRWKLGAVYMKNLLNEPITDMLKGPFSKSAYMYMHSRWIAFGKKAPASEVEFLQGIAADVPLKTMKYASRACLEHRYEYYLPNVKIPVLLLVGSEDCLTSKDRGNERTHNILPDSRLKSIEEAGHNAMLEKPDEVNNALDEFFTECFSGVPVSADNKVPADGAAQSTDSLVSDVT
jgi:pimeloyl-ACP methyl ester carboxylesterase